MAKQNNLLCCCFLRQTEWTEPAAVHFPKKGRDEPLILLKSARLCPGTMGGSGSEENTNNDFRNSNLILWRLNLTQSGQKARTLARINLQISRLSKKKNWLFCVLGPLSAFEVGETVFVSSPHVQLQTSTSLCFARRLRGRLMPFRPCTARRAEREAMGRIVEAVT